MFAFQPTFSTIDFKQENNQYKISALKSKGVYSSKLFALHNLSTIIKYLDCKIRLKCSNSFLVVEKKLRNQNSKCLHCL